MAENKYLASVMEISPGGVARRAQVTEFERLLSERAALIAELKALGFDSFLADPIDIETCQADIQFFQDALEARRQREKTEVETGQPAIRIPSRMFPSKGYQAPEPLKVKPQPKREQSKVFDVDVEAAREYQLKAEQERKAAVSKMPIYEQQYLRPLSLNEKIAELIAHKRKKGMVPLKFDERGIPYIFAHESALDSAKKVFLGEK